ncbi:MAG: hypothetical protein LBM01_01920 [Christensenellaceae bacterium]|jgi:hypothetical protein|nr:hypothetical protein [Christensenellaceae bacterium]
MQTIESIAKNFLFEEKMTVADALEHGAVGLNVASGKINGMLYSVLFNKAQMSEEINAALLESCGEALYSIAEIILSAGGSVENVVREFVSSWAVKNERNKETHASILEMLKHRKVEDKVKSNERKAGATPLAPQSASKSKQQKLGDLTI